MAYNMNKEDSTLLLTANLYEKHRRAKASCCDLFLACSSTAKPLIDPIAKQVSLAIYIYHIRRGHNLPPGPSHPPSLLSPSSTYANNHFLHHTVSSMSSSARLAVAALVLPLLLLISLVQAQNTVAEIDVATCIDPARVQSCSAQRITTSTNGHANCTAGDDYCNLAVTDRYQLNILGCLYEGCWNRVCSCSVPFPSPSHH